MGQRAHKISFACGTGDYRWTGSAPGARNQPGSATLPDGHDLRDADQRVAIRSVLRVLHREPVIGVGDARRRPDDGRDGHSSQEIATHLRRLHGLSGCLGTDPPVTASGWAVSGNGRFSRGWLPARQGSAIGHRCRNRAAASLTVAGRGASPGSRHPPGHGCAEESWRTEPPAVRGYLCAQFSLGRDREERLTAG